MKAVIVEIKGKYAIALNKQGEFIRIRNSKKYQIGCEADISTVVRFNASTPARACSIAAAFFVVIGLWCYSYIMPYAYIDMDINPSVEMVVNIYDRIIGAEGLNEDGAKLLSSGGYKNRRLSDGVGALIDNAVKEGYLKENQPNAVVLSVSSKNRNKALEIGKKIENRVAEELNTSHIETELVVENATLEKHENARMMGISPGKLSLIGKLIEEEPCLEIQDLKDVPVRQIMKSIKETKKETKATEKSEKSNNSSDKKEKIEAANSKTSEVNTKDGTKQNSSGPEKSSENGNMGKAEGSGKDKGNVENGHEIEGKREKEEKEKKEKKEKKESEKPEGNKEIKEVKEEKEAKKNNKAKEAGKDKDNKEDKENKESKGNNKNNKPEKTKENGLGKDDKKSGSSGKKSSGE